MNNVEQILAQNGFYAAPVHGISMLPLLCEHRDVVYIEPAKTIRKLDVVLFRRDNGQLVLHRVLKTDADNQRLLVSGDNDRVTEQIAYSQVLGVMTSFCRKGKTVSASAISHRVYARLWNATLPTKLLLQKISRRLKKGGRV